MHAGFNPLTVHLVAFYEELVVLQTPGRVHDLGSDVVIQVPVDDNDNEKNYKLDRSDQNVLLKLSTVPTSSRSHQTP